MADMTALAIVEKALATDDLEEWAAVSTAMAGEPETRDRGMNILLTEPSATSGEVPSMPWPTRGTGRGRRRQSAKSSGSA